LCRKSAVSIEYQHVTETGQQLIPRYTLNEVYNRPNASRSKQVSAAADRPARRNGSRPRTVLYTHVDGQYDKLVTDDGHQFTALTVHQS